MVADPEKFSDDYQAECLSNLFWQYPTESGTLRDLYLASGNTRAKENIQDFALVYDRVVDLAEQQGDTATRDAMHGIAEKYLKTILDDRLDANKSAFGSGVESSELRKDLRKLQENVKSLITRQTHCKLMVYGDALMGGRVKDFIRLFAEQEGGGSLTKHTSNRILGWADNAAREALQQSRDESAKAHARGSWNLGSVARDIREVTNFPKLLRSFMESAVQQAPENSARSTPPPTPRPRERLMPTLHMQPEQGSLPPINVHIHLNGGQGGQNGLNGSNGLNGLNGLNVYNGVNCPNSSNGISGLNEFTGPSELNAHVSDQVNISPVQAGKTPSISSHRSSEVGNGENVEQKQDSARNIVSAPVSVGPSAKADKLASSELKSDMFARWRPNFSPIFLKGRGREPDGKAAVAEMWIEEIRRALTFKPECENAAECKKITEIRDQYFSAAPTFGVGSITDKLAFAVVPEQDMEILRNALLHHPQLRTDLRRTAANFEETTLGRTAGAPPDALYPAIMALLLPPSVALERQNVTANGASLPSDDLAHNHTQTDLVRRDRGRSRTSSVASNASSARSSASSGVLSASSSSSGVSRTSSNDQENRSVVPRTFAEKIVFFNSRQTPVINADPARLMATLNQYAGNWESQPGTKSWRLKQESTQTVLTVDGLHLSHFNYSETLNTNLKDILVSPGHYSREQQNKPPKSFI